jgi:ribosome-associated toxin RatA of RatAB toxin-antitoxin module
LVVSAVAVTAGEASDAERERLERGEVIVTGDVDEAENVGHGKAVALMEGSPARLIRVVTDYEGQPEFMPFMEACRVIERDGDEAVVWSRSKVLFFSFEFTRRLTVDRGARTVSWAQVDGDFRVNRGSWTFEPWGDGRTRVTYRLEIAPRMRLPSMVIRRVSQSGLDDLLRAVRARARDARYDAPEPSPAPGEEQAPERPTRRF